MKKPLLLLCVLLGVCSIAVATQNIVVIPLTNHNIEEQLIESATNTINEIIEQKNLFVVTDARTVTSDSYNLDESQILKLGEELNANYLITGSITQVKKKFSINLQLVEADSGFFIKTYSSIANEQADIPKVLNNLIESLNLENYSTVKESLFEEVVEENKTEVSNELPQIDDNNLYVTTRTSDSSTPKNINDFNHGLFKLKSKRIQFRKTNLRTFVKKSNRNIQAIDMQAIFNDIKIHLIELKFENNFVIFNYPTNMILKDRETKRIAIPHNFKNCKTIRIIAEGIHEETKDTTRPELYIFGVPKEKD